MYENQILTVRHPILPLGFRKMGPLASVEEKVGEAHSPVSGGQLAVGDALEGRMFAAAAGGADALEELRVAVGHGYAGLAGCLSEFGKLGFEDWAMEQCMSKRALLRAHIAGPHSRSV